MSDKDSVKREEVLNHLGDLFTLCSETGNITQRDLEIFEKIIKSLSPVEHPMSAVEFGKTRERLCSTCSCSSCPLMNIYTGCKYHEINDDTVAIVEKWAREHKGVNNE